MSSTGPVALFSTCMPANSGIHLVIGSSSLSLPSSISISAATEVTGLVIEAMRKMVSRVIGAPASMSRWPSARNCSSWPPRQISVTAPERSPDVDHALQGGRDLAQRRLVHAFDDARFAVHGLVSPEMSARR